MLNVHRTRQRTGVRPTDRTVGAGRPGQPEGGQRHPGKRTGVFVSRAQHRLEQELAAQAEVAYERLVKDWVPSRKNGAGSANGARISRR